MHLFRHPRLKKWRVGDLPKGKPNTFENDLSQTVVFYVSGILGEWGTRRDCAAVCRGAPGWDPPPEAQPHSSLRADQGPSLQASSGLPSAHTLTRRPPPEENPRILKMIFPPSQAQTHSRGTTSFQRPPHSNGSRSWRGVLEWGCAWGGGKIIFKILRFGF